MVLVTQLVNVSVWPPGLTETRQISFQFWLSNKRREGMQVHPGGDWPDMRSNRGGNPSLTLGCSTQHLKEISLSAESPRPEIESERSSFWHSESGINKCITRQTIPLSVSTNIGYNSPQMFKQFRKSKQTRKDPEWLHPRRPRSCSAFKRGSADPTLQVCTHLQLLLFDQSLRPVHAASSVSCFTQEHTFITIRMTELLRAFQRKANWFLNAPHGRSEKLHVCGCCIVPHSVGWRDPLLFFSILNKLMSRYFKKKAWFSTEKP